VGLICFNYGAGIILELGTAEFTPKKLVVHARVR